MYFITGLEPATLFYICIVLCARTSFSSASASHACPTALGTILTAWYRIGTTREPFGASIAAAT